MTSGALLPTAACSCVLLISDYLYHTQRVMLMDTQTKEDMDIIEIGSPSPPEQSGPWRWSRGAKPYVDKHGVLDEAVAWDELLDYAPFEDPALPTHAAKVLDERSALRFVRGYGLFRHSGLLLSDVVDKNEIGGGPHWDELVELDGGEPLDWVIAQSRSIRFALELVASLHGTGDPTATVLARYRLPESRPGKQSYPTVLHLQEKAVELPNDVPPEDAAATLLRMLTSRNTRGVRNALVADSSSPSGFHGRLVAAALVEVVWWHVQRWAADGVVRLCELDTCRTPFLVTDQRQRFCPGETLVDPVTGEVRTVRSRCAALHQKRHQRQRGE